MWHSVFLKIRMESSPLVQSTLISLCIYSLRGTVTAAKFSVCIKLQISAGPCASWNSMGLFLFTDDIYPLISFWKPDSFSVSHGECTYRTFFSCHVCQQALHRTVSMTARYGAAAGASSSQTGKSLAGHGSKRVPKCNSLVLQEETESG